MKTMAKFNELCFNLLPRSPYSPDLARSDYWLFADSKKMLQEKRFGSNEVIVTTEAYFKVTINLSTSMVSKTKKSGGMIVSH